MLRMFCKNELVKKEVGVGVVVRGGVVEGVGLLMVLMVLLLMVLLILIFLVLLILLSLH